MRYPETGWYEEHDYIAFASASFRREKTQKTFRGLPRLQSGTIFQVLWHNPAYHYVENKWRCSIEYDANFLTCIIVLYSNLIWTWNTRIILGIWCFAIGNHVIAWPDVNQHHLSAPHSMAGPGPIIPGPNEKRLQNQFPKEVMKPQPSKQVWPLENAGGWGWVAIVFEVFARNQCCPNQLTRFRT